MTIELDDPTAGDDQLRASLRGLAEEWANSAQVPPGRFAARARQAWRRRVAVCAAASTLAVTGIATVGFAIGPSLHAAVRPVTISASSPPATPPEYAGYTTDAFTTVAKTHDGGFSVKGGRLPDFLPVVNAHGLVGLTDDPAGEPGVSGTVVRDLDSYSDGGPTDMGFGVTIPGIEFEGDVSGRGPGRPLVLSWFKPSMPLAVGQILYAGQDGAGTKVAGRVPVGTITRLLPSIYPDKHDDRAEVTPFADLAHPGQVWVLRKPGDDPTPAAQATSPTFPLPGEKHLSPTQKLLTIGGYTLSDFASVDPYTGKPQACTMLVNATGGEGPDCRTAAKLGRNSLSVDVGGSYMEGSDTIYVVGRAGTSVASVVVVLDDGTRVNTVVADGGAAYAGKYFVGTWTGKVPADKAIAYDASGRQVGTTTTYYGGGGSS